MKLTEKQQEIFEELFVRYPVLEKNREDILKAYEVLETCYRTEIGRASCRERV